MNAGYKAAVNTFYRHILVFFNPLAPMFIVIADLSTLGFLPIMQFHLIPVIVTCIIGHIILKRMWPTEVKQDGDKAAESFGTSLKNLFIAGFPLILAMSLALVFGVHFIIALSSAIVFMIFYDIIKDKILTSADIKPIFVKGINWKLGLSVYTILLFGEFVKNSGTTPIIAQIINDSHLPLLLILMVSSVAIGFTAGHPIVGAAILYPIFLPLVGDSVAYLSLIFTGMMLGYMVSPVHLCLIVSNEFYKTDYVKNNRLLLPLQVILTIVAVVVAVTLFR
jgi:hypothetical protein